MLAAPRMTQRRAAPPPLTVLLLSWLRLAAAATTCDDELEKACGAKKSGPYLQCISCIAANHVDLKDCNATQEILFCPKPPPLPPPPPAPPASPTLCAAELDKACGSEKANFTQCAKCIALAKVKKELSHCNMTLMAPFCPKPILPPPKPPADPEQCDAELLAACGNKR
eukprot:SAG22_NODE_6717_length_820_cov_1.201110_1_plen_168_part_10